MTNVPTRIGVIGLGSAGMLHVQALLKGEVPGASLAAVVSRPSRFQAAALLLAPHVRHFEALETLFAANVCDAVIVATPHLLHPEQAIAALRAGYHVFCEKPAGIRLWEAREMASVADQRNRVYTLNYNRRTVPLYRRLRELVRSGEIGDLRRVHWTSTSWLRVQSYFDSSPWRGTWSGEGGGLLVNQWPHILDLWQWIFGMPTRLQAHCGFGKHHAIEVEDEVNIFAEYKNGANAFLTGSTGEAPGLERIEIVGSRGSIISLGDQLTITRLKMRVRDFIDRAPAGFSSPKSTTETETHDPEGDLVTGITRNFVAAIQSGGDYDQIAPGSDGVAGVMLANAVLLSAWADGGWVSLPLDSGAEERFECLLSEKIKSSKPRTPSESAVFDLKDSFRLPSN